MSASRRSAKKPRLKDQGGISVYSVSSEATTGFEPVMRVLQTLALPLGDVAAMERERDYKGSCIRNCWGVAMRNPVRAASSVFQCFVFVESTQSGRASIAVTTTGTSFS